MLDQVAEPMTRYGGSWTIEKLESVARRAVPGSVRDASIVVDHRKDSRIQRLGHVDSVSSFRNCTDAPDINEARRHRPRMGR